MGSTSPKPSSSSTAAKIAAKKFNNKNPPFLENSVTRKFTDSLGKSMTLEIVIIQFSLQSNQQIRDVL